MPSRLAASTLISLICAATKVVPSQATPSTQMQALIPDLKVAALRMFLASTLQNRQIRVAAPSMKEMIASSRVRIGFLMRAKVELMAMA